MEPCPRIALCKAAEVEEGKALKVEHGELTLAVFHIEDGYFVTDDACTHGPGSLSEGEIYGTVIECDFHHGAFDIRTGEVVTPPCMVPLKTYKTSLEGGDVMIEL